MGAMSITSHFVSPLTNHFFNRAIITTGSIFVNSIMYSNHDQLADQIIKMTKCDDQDFDDEQLVSCLRSKSTASLLTVVKQINDDNPISFMFNPDDEFFNFTR